MMASRERKPLRATHRPGVPGRDTGKPRRRAGRGKDRRGRSRWRSLLRWSLLVLLAGPGLVILLYAVVAPPVTPLMLIRAIEGEGIFKSLDGGETWFLLPSTASNPDFIFVNRIAIAPTSTSVLFIGIHSIRLTGP